MNLRIKKLRFKRIYFYWIIIITLIAGPMAYNMVNTLKFDNSVPYKTGTLEYAIAESMNSENIPVNTEFKYIVDDGFVFAVATNPNKGYFYKIYSKDQNGNYTTSVDRFGSAMPILTRDLVLDIMPSVDIKNKNYVFSFLINEGVYPDKRMITNINKLELFCNDNKLNKIESSDGVFTVFVFVTVALPDDLDFYAMYDGKKYPLLNSEIVKNAFK